jgi:uncharacterized protein YebE (UPF0316 family)
MTETILGALLIFGLRICDVSLGTIRMIVSIQGRRYIAAAIAFVEVSIFVVAIGKVIGQLDNVINIFAYSGGFACGTILGIQLEGRLALGNRIVRIITHRPNDLLVTRLRDAGFGVTTIQGEGRDGTVHILFSVVRRKAVTEFMEIVKELAPKAFVTIEEARETVHGHLPAMGGRFK